MEYILFLLLLLIGITFKYPRNIYVEVSWTQFLEIASQDSQAIILAGKTSSRRVAHAIFINGVWYICFESITEVDRMALLESRLLIVKKIHGI